ncbi:MAG TPA: hypothetical protein VK324_12960, partial [Tepidisphaeraceae bacterium]|nr:hypothetical protein [Tepidisphaeraceae bacterium]
MSAPGELPSSLRALLDDVARRQRRVAVARGAGAAVALSIAWVLAWCVADRLLHLPAWTRAIALGLNVLGITAVSVVAVRRWVAGGTDYVAVSRAIEDADPALGERLVTVTSRLIGPASYRGSDALLGQVTSDAATRAAELRPAAVVRRRAAAEAWGVAAVELVAAAGLW